MKVSLNTITRYVDFALPATDELVSIINTQLGGVEEVIDLSAQYKDAIIVKVVTCEKHPNADKLSICQIDIGSNEQVQVVCGAPNVHADMWAVWLPPESIVPATFDDAEPFVLGARELRGVMSHGMLAAGDELALNNDHDGIVEVTEADLPSGVSLTAGAHFATVFGLDDTIIDIENKMFTHRPDLFGQIGVARELSAIIKGVTSSDDGLLDTAYSGGQDDLAWYWQMPTFTSAKQLTLDVYNDVTSIVPRFMTVAMSNVKVKSSPLWLQAELLRLGSKTINTVVDVTNYVMLLTAQPTHAYDYDKLSGHTIGARLARHDETVTLLNDKTYHLDENDIVIADGDGVIGLAGIMGGKHSEVTRETTNIVLEVGTFDMYAVRRSSMRHGLFTDALTRFNKGQSPLQNDRVIARLISLLREHAGAEQASDVHDTSPSMNQAQQTLSVDVGYINARLDTSFTAAQIGNLLQRVNFSVHIKGDELRLGIPFWRTDIALPEDIIEEVGRLYGYDKLPRILPLRSIKPTPTNPIRELAQTVRTSLARAGANEVLTYSFVHERVLAAAGQNASDTYQLSNAISPDLQCYRLSLTPSLLDKVHANIKAGHDEFALFEIGKSHSKKAGRDSDGLPFEPGRIAFSYAAKVARDGAAYYRAKRTLDYLASELGMALEYKMLPAGSTLTAAAPFVDGRTARVIDVASEQAIGIIGEYAPSVRKAFKLPDYTAGFELFTEGLLLAQKSQRHRYRPLSRYPSVERDVCFEVTPSTTYSELTSRVAEVCAESDLTYDILPIDIYQADKAVRRITIRVRLTSQHETLTSERTNTFVDETMNTVAQQLGARII